MWISPKTDWVLEDWFNITDYERIVTNIFHLKDMLVNIYPDFEVENMEINQTHESIPYARKINLIERNIELLNRYSYEFDIGETKTYTANQSMPTSDEYNRLERACLSIYNKLSAQLQNNTAPTIHITSDYGDWATSQNYDIEGYIDVNGNGVKDVKVYYTEGGVSKEATLPISHDGNFLLGVTLMPNVNKFVVRARDIDDNPSFVTFEKWYDAVPPVITLTQPTSGDTISANARTFTIAGSVTDAHAGLKEVTINDNLQELIDDSFTYTTDTGTQDYVIQATDNADNVRTKTVRIVRSNYESVRHWSGEKSGNQAYRDYSQCNVCGRFGESESKWVANGQPVHQNESSSWFRNCPNGPHYKYTITIN